MEDIENIEDIPQSTLNMQSPNTLNDFDPKVIKAVAKAVQVEKEIDEKLPIKNNDTCPINANIITGGMKRVQRGGPRRGTKKSGTQSAPLAGLSDDESGENTGSDRDATTTAEDDVVRFSLERLEYIRKKRQEAMAAIANIPEKTADDIQLTEAQVNEQIEGIMQGTGMQGQGLFSSQDETNQFTAHAREIREAMIKMRGIGPNEELRQLQEQAPPAAARATRIASLKQKAIDERPLIDDMPPGAEKDEAEEALQKLEGELKRLETEETRINQLVQEQRENRYYFMLSIMAHISAALFIGMTGAPQAFFNSIGENVRFMFGADNLAASCDYDNFFNLGYNGDCETATRAAEIMWTTIIGVIGLLAVTFFGITLSDTTNPFMILAGLGAYSVDSLAALFRAMGGITATVGAVAGAAAPIAQTVGGVITWPLTRVANVCLRMVGRQPYRGGRKRRRTMKHRRKTRGRKGKKMRRTKNKRKRGSRKKQRGGTNLIPMLDGYRPSSAKGGKKRRKGRKGKKTRGKTKRRHGKKRGTRKH